MFKTLKKKIINLILFKLLKMSNFTLFEFIKNNKNY